MAVDLSPPPVDEAAGELRHDPTFLAWDAGLSTLRDVVNLGIRALNQVGAGLSELPGVSLEDLLVEPLVGGDVAIRQNAVAARRVEAALRAHAGRLHVLTLRVDPLWGGRAAAAYVVRLQGRVLAAHALAALVARGALALDEVADVSERLALEVERLVVELAETLARLVRTLLRRVAGPAGWAGFAAELALTGLDAVTDVLDDVRRVLALVETLRELQTTVADWAHEQEARLRTLLDLPELLAVGL